MIDGGFLTKVLEARTGNFPSREEVETECDRIKQHAALADRELLRIYFYHAPPATERLTNPVDGSMLNLGQTAISSVH